MDGYITLTETISYILIKRGISMDILILNTDDVNYLYSWRDKALKNNPMLLYNNIVPLNSLEVVIDKSMSYRYFKSGNNLNVYHSLNHNKIGKIKYQLIPYGKAKMISDTITSSLELTAKQADAFRADIYSLWKIIMTFMVYGSELANWDNNMLSIAEKERRKYSKATQHRAKKSSSSKKQPVTYILKREPNKSSIKVKGSHNSPSFSFGVRGHFRRYKDGKVVWIDPYVKGNKKKKDKNYRLGKS